MDLNDEMSFCIEFMNATGGSLGKFTFDKDRCEFVGAADECAKQFVEEVKKQWLLQSK